MGNSVLARSKFESHKLLIEILYDLGCLLNLLSIFAYDIVDSVLNGLSMIISMQFLSFLCFMGDKNSKEA